MNDGSGWQDGQFYRADMSLDHQKWLTNPLEMDSPNTYREDDEKSNTSIVHRSTSDSLLPHSSNFFPGQYSYSLSNSNNRFEDDVMINKAQSDSRLRVGLMGSLETEDPYSSNMLQFSRHARRLYVGGIPPSYTNEDMLRTFLNEVISKCLEEEYSNGHILSVYMNHKKCFAFVELKSIELATACLELDGIVYKSNILKIQRANEYKPELLPNIASVPVKLNFSKAPFPKNLIDHGKDKPPGPGINVGSGSGSGTSTGMSLIQRCYLAEVRQGNIVLIGFPYDEGSRRAGGRGGSYAAPVSIRNHLQNFFVQGYNPEYNIDLAQIRILDVGDVAPGMNLESASVRLESAITEIIRRGAIPIVLGGSNDVAYWCSTGLISAVGGPVDVVTLNSSLDMSFPSNEGKIQANSTFRMLLEDIRFCAPRDGPMSMPSCDHRLVCFGTQGVCCTREDLLYCLQREADVVWLSKDIRNVTIPSPDISNDQEKVVVVPPVHKIFTNTLSHSAHRPIHVNFDVSSIAVGACPGSSRKGPATGFSADESVSLCLVAGANPNVVALSIGNFNPEIEELKSAVLIAEMIYNFFLGVRARQARAKPNALSVTSRPSISTSATPAANTPYVGGGQSRPTSSSMGLIEKNNALLGNVIGTSSPMGMNLGLQGLPSNTNSNSGATSGHSHLEDSDIILSRTQNFYSQEPFYKNMNMNHSNSSQGQMPPRYL